ncbi:protein CEPU-1 [Elysia marginata]|uniref:Protein CEPU-1 n=1 Tax=Elysia marginata TaxID=1093978 RepID=A0AAV4G162_9GAST|nr:protein CEPU-1 [Elysia marginata]
MRHGWESKSRPLDHESDAPTSEPSCSLLQPFKENKPVNKGIWFQQLPSHPGSSSSQPTQAPAAPVPTMTTIRSSVRPSQPKQPWGTILKPEFGMGYQKMTEYEIEQTVSRLSSIPAPKEQVYHRPNPKMSQEEIEAMVSQTLIMIEAE